MSAFILFPSPNKHLYFSKYMKGLAQVMADNWVFGGNIILNCSAVQHSLDHLDYMWRKRGWSGLPGSPDH